MAIVIPGFDTGSGLRTPSDFGEENGFVDVFLPGEDVFFDFVPIFQKHLGRGVFFVGNFMVGGHSDPVEFVPEADLFVMVPVCGIEEFSMVDRSGFFDDFHPSGTETFG